MAASAAAVMAAKACANASSSMVRTATGWGVRPSARAAPSISRKEPSGVPAVGRRDRSATREMPGTASLSSANRCPRLSSPRTLTPVTLPPGPAVLDGAGLSPHVAPLAQPLAKGVRKAAGHLPKVADPGECRRRWRRGERHREQAEGEGDEEPDGAARHGSLLRSWMVGVFYARPTRQGKQILPIKPLTSVERRYGHTGRLPYIEACRDWNGTRHTFAICEVCGPGNPVLRHRGNHAVRVLGRKATPIELLS